MKKQVHPHVRKRAASPSVRKQEILRRERRKQEKYPIRAAYYHSSIHKQSYRGV